MRGLSKPRLSGLRQIEQSRDARHRTAGQCEFLGPSCGKYKPSTNAPISSFLQEPPHQQKGPPALDADALLLLDPQVAAHLQTLAVEGRAPVRLPPRATRLRLVFGTAKARSDFTINEQAELQVDATKRAPLFRQIYQILISWIELVCQFSVPSSTEAPLLALLPDDFRGRVDSLSPSEVETLNLSEHGALNLLVRSRQARKQALMPRLFVPVPVELETLRKTLSQAVVTGSFVEGVIEASKTKEFLALIMPHVVPLEQFERYLLTDLVQVLDGQERRRRALQHAGFDLSRFALFGSDQTFIPFVVTRVAADTFVRLIKCRTMNPPDPDCPDLVKDAKITAETMETPRSDCLQGEEQDAVLVLAQIFTLAISADARSDWADRVTALARHFCRPA